MSIAMFNFIAGAVTIVVGGIQTYLWHKSSEFSYKYILIPIIILGIVYYFFAESWKDLNLTVLESSFENVQAGEIKIYYPKPFSKPPHLKIVRENSFSTNKVDINIKSQETDGFTIETLYGISRGYSWIATGDIQR